jgi:DNA-binding MarR family transcriptional regulator
VARTTLDTAALAHDLRLAVMRFSRRLRNQRVDTSVTLTHLAALSTLKRHGPMSPGELAGHERVQPPSMTRTVNWLEEEGYVARRRADSDGRQVLVSLSETGRAVVLADRDRRDAWLAQRLRDLTPEERDVLRRAAPILQDLAQKD